MKAPLNNYKLIALAAVVVLFAIATTPALGQGCPSANAIGNFQQSNDGLQVSIDLSDPGSLGYNTRATYFFTSNDETPANGVPGLIEYCVYPAPPSGNPDSATPQYDSWKAVFGSIQGYFAFKRPNGDPTNVPLDGTTQLMGYADWASGVPADQVVLLHINDADECAALYGGNPGTCFVFPGGGVRSHRNCVGQVACKTVIIDEADTSAPDTVPAFTNLHIHYTYTVQNILDGPDMMFNVPGPKTQDINSGGMKDYFGCEQTPDPDGIPDAWEPAVTNFPGLPGFLVNFITGKGNGCQQSSFKAAANASPVVLHSGDSLTFQIDMTTRLNKGGKREFTSCGVHFLNSGFTIKWIQSDDNQLHSFTTAPIAVNVVGCN